MASAAAQTFAVTALMMVLVAVAAESSVTCNDVASSLLSCINYAQNGGQVPPACCSGVGRLKAAATTAGDRQTACRCIKTLAMRIAGIKEEHVAAIPDKCGVDIGYPVSFSVDCSKVK